MASQLLLVFPHVIFQTSASLRSVVAFQGHEPIQLHLLMRGANVGAHAGRKALSHPNPLCSVVWFADMTPSPLISPIV